MKPIRCGVFRSEGRTRLPSVGPPPQISLSNSIVVITFSKRVYPYSSKTEGSYTSIPVAAMTTPTLRSISSSFIFRLVHFFSQTSTHLPQVMGLLPRQLFISIIYDDG